MGRISKGIRRCVDHPITKLSVGLVLFVTGFLEAYQAFSQDFSQFQVGAHHGIMVFGFVNMISSIPDIVEGVSSGGQYLEHLEAKRDDKG